MNMQIRTRLTLQFIVLVAGILVLSLCFIHFKFKQMAEEEFYDSLRSKALMTAEMVLSSCMGVPWQGGWDRPARYPAAARPPIVRIDEVAAGAAATILMRS